MLHKYRMHWFPLKNAISHDYDYQLVERVLCGSIILLSDFGYCSKRLNWCLTLKNKIIFVLYESIDKSSHIFCLLGLIETENMETASIRT